MNIYCLLVLVCYLVATSNGTTVGTRFHLVFMENLVDYPGEGPLEVFVSNTGSLTASVTVSSPMHNCPSQDLTVPAGSNVKFEVCWWMRLVSTDYWPSYKTVLVESDRNVTVYAYNKELFSADGYYAIPTSELAYSYVLTMFGDPNIATQFAISAINTTTSVQISLPIAESVPVEINYKGLVYTNGDTFTLSLAQYETYLGQSRGDLTGAKILSNAPIAVFSGNVRNKGSAESRDHMAAQLQPTDNWGSKFSVAPVPRSTNLGDFIRVTAKRPDTQFTMRFANGSEMIKQLLSDEPFYHYDLSQPCVVTSESSSNQLQVVQMVKSQSAPKIADVADPTMFLLVAASQWLNDYISPALTYAKDGQPYLKNFAFLSVTNGQESGLRVDGNTISANWTRINGIASSWIDVGAGSHRFTHTSNQDFGVMVYGASDRESYGFALGADLGSSECRDVLMTRGDGMDNDCDGSVDEETCNAIDDDSDGLIDEDCRKSSVEAVGNEYTLMFMENNVDDNPDAKSFLEIYISAADANETVNYTLSHEYGKLEGSIKQGAVEIIANLSVNLRQIGSGHSTKAISIRANSDIVVYGINKQTFSTDGFLAFPNDVVGNEYYTAHYFPGGGSDLNEFAFTPVYNDSGPIIVRVTMPNVTNCTAVFDSETITAGKYIDVSLSYGQTAQFQSATTSDNLNGAHVKSSRPFSLFSGNVRAKVEPTMTADSRDHLVQQLAPVSTWGNEFVTVPIPRSDKRGDIFFVTASVASTNLQLNIKTKNGSISQQTIVLANAGDYKRLDVRSEEYAHITTDHPVQVFQYVKTTADRLTERADPAMLMIPPVEQWSRNYRFITPRTGQDDGNGSFLPFETSVLLAINSSYRDGLTLDDVTLPSTVEWVELNGTDYSASMITVADTKNKRHKIGHRNPDVFFQALIYGRADRESYALPIGMKLATRECVITTATAMHGDGIDNDCDGSVDEELCNDIDDDADGEVDEDCGSGLSSGTTFFLTYMENTVEYYRGFNLELYVAVVGDQTATVDVSAPLVEWPSYNIITEVKPGKVQAYGLAPYLRNEGQGLFKNTVFVRSNEEIVVYGVNKEKFSNDAFLVYPVSSLGTDHYTCSWSPSTLPTEFAVVATQDNTVVTITLPSGRGDILVSANGRDYSSGETFSVTLQRFEVYQAQSAGDLTGTRVQTSNRSAVFSGNVRTNVELSGSRDHLVQQMLPTGSYGKEFSVVPFPGRTVGDILRLVADKADTEVRVNGRLVYTIAEAGDFLQYQLASTSRITITSSKPVMVVQFVKSQDGRDNPEEADPAMFLVPSNDNFITVATFITPVYSGGRTAGLDYTNYVTIVILGGEQGNVRLDGEKLSQETIWDAIDSSGYVTATFTVESGRTHKITTTSSASFYGRLYGRADRESYAFPIGFRF